MYNHEPTPPYLKRGRWIRRARRVLLYLLGVTLTCGGICGGMYWFYELRPQYIELDPPDLPCVWWYSNTERSVVTSGDSRQYFWRIEGSCCKSSCGNCESTDACESDCINGWQDLYDRFNIWLEAEGWIATKRENSCYGALPEYEFLERGENGYVVYWPADVGGWNLGESLCLAIYSYPEDAPSWKIVLATANPSPFTEFARGID